MTNTIRTALLAATALLLPMAAHAQPVGPAELMGKLGTLLVPNRSAPTPNALYVVGPAPSGLELGITVYLKPGDPDGLAAFVDAVQRPHQPGFHQFLTGDQFQSRFGPTPTALAAVQNALTSAGFRIDNLFANHLAIRVTGTVSTIDRFFGLTLQTVQQGGGTGYASTTQPVFPASVAAYLRGVGGFETLVPSAPGPVQSTAANYSPLRLANVTLDPATAQASGVTRQPGALYPSDYQRLYGVMPLVAAGATGAGQTIGIVTEQPFDGSDAVKFWSVVGVQRAPVQFAFVDGTSNASLTSASMIGESDLDTEQAGAIAPGAALRAYVTRSGPSGLLDGFEAAASENVADVVSSSFGTPEPYFQPNGTIMYNSTLLPAFDDVFLQIAAQGQTVFAAAGDAGAFGVNRNENGYYWVFPGGTGPAAYTPLYSVNAIAANPLVTAAGGTTLPISGTDGNASPPFNVRIEHEQPWSLSYLLTSQFAQNGNLQQTVSLLELAFPEGGGGGISNIYKLPAYQSDVPGILATRPSALVQLGGTPRVLAIEPANFPGRNLPDLSANADTNSGYLHVVHGQVLTGGSGTSVVAPQFAATQALINQLLGHRTGQLNPLLYRLFKHGAAPARDIAAGDNWGYLAHPGYDQATGLGVMDAARLLAGLRSYDDV